MQGDAPAIETLCVFCGASPGKGEVYTHAAKVLGQEIVRRKLSLVYGGGTVGVMGVVAREVHQGGMKVVGVIPGALAPREVSGEAIGEVVVVQTMHERKATMAARADAFIALPGGYGTLEELFEVITWQQLGIHKKPIGLLNVNNYYDPLLAMVQRGFEEGFINERYKSLLVVASEPAELLDKLQAHKPPDGFLNTWAGPIGLEQT